VWSEVTDVDYEDESVSGIINAEWPKQVFIADIPPDISAWELGAGESEVLTFASQFFIRRPYFLHWEFLS
jgi:hypothetical protein